MKKESKLMSATNGTMSITKRSLKVMIDTLPNFSGEEIPEMVIRNAQNQRNTHIQPEDLPIYFWFSRTPFFVTWVIFFSLIGQFCCFDSTETN